MILEGISLLCTMYQRHDRIAEDYDARLQLMASDRTKKRTNTNRMVESL